MSEQIEIRQCTSLEDFSACVSLQRVIWREQDLEVVPDTLFVVAAHTGGQVLGAFDGGALVGFTLALSALRNGAPYLHSHMTGVHSDYRDRGVGRALKLFQRDEALSRDIRLVEWTFDPLEMRNAHFNLNRLGAISRRYLPNLYGITSSPLHRGLATDRLVAEWYLDSPRVMAALSGEPSASTVSACSIEIPANVEDWKSSDLPRVQATQSDIAKRFSAAFAKGYAAIGVSKTSSGAAYQLAPWSDF